MKQADLIKYTSIAWLTNTAYEIVLPNYYADAYEMDIFRLLQTQYIFEYEIKISRADFFRDEKKRKHVRLQMGMATCNKFFYLVPKNLVTADETPEHAGLIYWTNTGLITVKEAPLLHKRKFVSYKALMFRMAKRGITQEQKIRYWKGRFEQLRRETKQK